MKWTPQQDEFLTLNYGKLTAHSCAVELAMPGLTRMAIIGRASRLGLVSDRSAQSRNYQRPRPSKRRPASSIPAGRKGPVAPGKVGLATTSVDERMGGAGQFKEVVIREVLIDVPDYQCRVVPDIIALESHQCRWPLDAGGFCGNDKYRGDEHKDTSYCLTHMKLSINPRAYSGGNWSVK